MAGDMETQSNLALCRKNELQCRFLIHSIKLVNPSLPALLSTLVHTVTSNFMSAIQPPKNPRTEVLESLSLMMAERPILFPLPLPYLALNNLSVAPTPLPATPSVPGPQKVSPARRQSSAPQDDSNESGEVAGTGPAFIGQVFTMCDSSRRGLIAVRPVDVLKTLRLPPYMPSFLVKLTSQWMENALHLVFKDDMRGPVFRFYFDKLDATDYVKRLNLSGSMVGSCPLDAAYKYFKGKQGMFKFVADRKQVKVAKELLRKDRGEKAAKKFKGVPVFTARNLTIAMSTPQGVRWFRPYFFDKKQLDSLIGHSVDHYYQMLIHARRVQRHNQVVENSSDSFSGEPMEDDADGLLDPPEVQELMEELGQGGGGMEFVVLKALEAQVLDVADKVLLGHQWSRRLTGLQPRFPVIVDSFERRAAAAEVDLLAETKMMVANSESPTPEAQEKASATQLGGREEDTSTSGRDEGSGGSGHSNSSSRSQTAREVKSPFNLFGKNWGFNPHSVSKRKDTGDAGILEEDSDSEFQNEEESEKERQGEEETFQPKLTMMGIAMSGPVNGTDGGLQQAMAAAAKDIEDRVRKGEGSGREHGPLFIADLGAPPEVWGSDASSFPGWEDEEAGD